MHQVATYFGAWSRIGSTGWRKSVACLFDFNFFSAALHAFRSCTDMTPVCARGTLADFAGKGFPRRLLEEASEGTAGGGGAMKEVDFLVGSGGGIWMDAFRGELVTGVAGSFNLGGGGTD